MKTVIFESRTLPVKVVVIIFGNKFRRIKWLNLLFQQSKVTWYKPYSIELQYIGNKCVRKRRTEQHQKSGHFLIYDKRIYFRISSGVAELCRKILKSTKSCILDWCQDSIKITVHSMLKMKQNKSNKELLHMCERGNKIEPFGTSEEWSEVHMPKWCNFIAPFGK